MDYTNQVSKLLRKSVEMPPELGEDAKYVFSTTFTDPHTMAYKELSEALMYAMHQNQGADLAQYPPSQGHEALRELIAQNIYANRAIKSDPERIFLTEGAGGAIQSILDLLLEPGDFVLAEEFVYHGTMGQLIERGVNVVHIPTDNLGMKTDSLEATLNELRDSGKAPKLIYTIPVYQNPTGVILDLDRRHHMIRIAREFGVPILENDSYADFRIDGDFLPPSLMGIDNQDSVIYVSAFTKLLGCGLRLGYLVVPEQVACLLNETSLISTPSHLSAMAVYQFLSQHKRDHIAKVTDSLKSKRDAMVNALSANLPSDCSWMVPGGGMMVWVRFPENTNTDIFLPKALLAGVKYNPGSIFRAERDGKNYMRLTYSYNSLDEIKAGVEILADVVYEEGIC